MPSAYFIENIYEDSDPSEIRSYCLCFYAVSQTVPGYSEIAGRVLSATRYQRILSLDQ